MAREVDVEGTSYFAGDDGDEGVEEEDDEAFEGSIDEAGRDATDILADYVDRRRRGHGDGGGGGGG